MKIGFLIRRLTYFRYFNSIIDESLSRNINTICFHDYAQPKDGLKGYQFPNISKAPEFLNGVPNFIAYKSSDNLQYLLEKNNIDIIFSLNPPNFIFDNYDKIKYPFWVIIQNHADLFSYTIHDLNSADLIIGMTEYWLEMSKKYYFWGNKNNGFQSIFDNIKKKTVLLGCPELSSLKRLSDSNINKKYNIPENKKIVLLLTHRLWRFSFRGISLFDNGRLQSRLHQILNILCRSKLNYIRNLFINLNFKTLCKSILKFCELNNAILIVKYRKKTWLPKYLRSWATLCIDDKNDYTPTILELLKISDLCISTYQSMAVIESAFCKTPFLSILPDNNSPKPTNILGEEFDILFYDTSNPSLFNYPGVSYVIEPYKFIKDFKSIKISNFQSDNKSGKDYLMKYVGNKFGEYDIAHKTLNHTLKHFTLNN